MTERSVFLAALEYDEPAERSAYLDRACAGEPALRARVEQLLTAHGQCGSFLGRPAPERLAGDLAAGLGTDDSYTAPAAAAGDEGLDFLAPSDKPGSIGRLGHYEVQEVVGRGGMGVVLKAFDEALHRVVAVKVMASQLATSAPARRRFAREARAAAAVSHDHVVTIHAVEDVGPLPYIVMQYVAGASLQERLDRTGPLPLAEILRIGTQTASGLAAAHAQGLVHRDVKPANILLENGIERAKLTDFGLARAVDDASLTQSGTVAGTPAFMSPEQADGKPVDHRSDLFSLGSVLYAMCTGRPPFRASTVLGVLRRVCEETPTSVRQINPEVPDWLAAVVEKLHAKDPAARFQSAAEVEELLGQLLAHVQHPSVAPLSAVAKSAGQPLALDRPARRNRWAVAAAVVVATFAVLGTTEVTGVTHVRATVIRVFTPEGTLIVETDDPAVKVVVEGDGDLVITGAGPQEVRLRVGSYKLRATKDGQPVKLDRDLVNITRGDRQIVRVRLEGDVPAAAAPPAARGAFVLLGGKGVAERKFDTLAEAVLCASDGDTIEIRGDGPFVTEGIDLRGTALTIRAGDGFRPVLKLSKGGAESSRPLLVSQAALVLEGLELQRIGGLRQDGTILSCAGRHSLHITNCRFLVDVPEWGHCIKTSSPRCILRNSEFAFRTGYAYMWDSSAQGEFVLDNCVGQGGHFRFPGTYTNPPSVRLNHNTLLDGVVVWLESLPEAKDSPARIQFHTGDNVFDSKMFFLAVFGIEPSQAKTALAQRFAWNDKRNLYHITGDLVWASKEGFKNTAILMKPDDSLADWKRFWNSPDGEVRTGVPRYQGGDIFRKMETPAQLTAADFRLRPDSPGYRAGKDGKDLGADIDRVGPGAAYERWKKTPDYQQWLKETGQVKK
ncbi:MAG TPA: serine/threonine-protein kinase [Gemmataceae bacterium]|jgi:hypothetical protein